MALHRLAGLCLLLGSAAFAQDVSTETGREAEAASKSFAIALKTGVAVPSLFSSLGTTPGVELEVGVLLFGGRLELDAVAGYARPPATHSADDARLGGGSYQWELTQEILALGLNARFRFLPAASAFNAYAAAGPRMFLLRTTVNGGSGEATFGQNSQTGSELGFAGALGAELALGPGAVLAELELGVGPLQGLVTGPTSASSLGVLVGYRLKL